MPKEKIVFGLNSMRYISMFEAITRIVPLDCIVYDDVVVFVIPEKTLRFALGKDNINLRSLEKMINKKIRLVMHSNKLEQFVKNVAHPGKINKVTIDGKIVNIYPKDSFNRGIIIGRNATNLRKIEKIVRKFFDIDEIRVMKA